MVAQRNELVTQQFNFIPTTLEEATKFATIFANSGLCPEAYRGRPNDVLIVWQMGRELGLDKMQSLRTLGCINGVPFAYGDGKLALIKRHTQFEDMKEWLEGNIKDGTLIAFCTIKRKGKEPVTQSFSIEDAKLAGLWNKKGVWQQYPKRMLQHRARGFAANDAFPDVLFGIPSQEEAYDIVDSSKVVDMPVSNNKGMKGLKESLGIVPAIVEAEFVETVIDKNIVFSALKLEELKDLLAERKVKYQSITASLKGFGVASLEELTDEMIDKRSNHLKSKEKKDAI